MKLRETLKLVYDCGLENSMDMLDVTVNRELDNVTKIPYMKKILYGYFQECFTDGYYGDFDASKNYAYELEQNIFTSIGNLKYFLNINSVLERIPNLVYACIADNPNAFLAGGSVLNVLLNKNWQDSDWDIFCHPATEDRIICSLEKYNPQRNIKNNYQCWEVVVGKCKVQVIISEFSSVEEMLNRFDITICQFAISKMIPCIHGTNQAFSDLQKNVIKINPNIRNIKDREVLKRRIDKYYKRGFNKPTDMDDFIQTLPVNITPIGNPKKKVKLAIQGYQPIANQVAANPIQDVFAPVENGGIQEVPEEPDYGYENDFDEMEDVNGN